MNRTRRILLIGRHFWPHGSIDSGGHLIQLASGLQRLGLHVEVVTPRYENAWPEQIRFRELTVHRPVNAPKGDWSTGRYVRQLTSWLRENARSFDILLVDRAETETIAAAEACRTLGSRCVIRACGWGDQCDVSRWSRSKTSRRCASYAKVADAIIAQNPDCHRQLIVDGFSESRIHRIQPGFGSADAASDSTKALARDSLAAANADLRVDDGCFVVLCVGKMNSGGAIHQFSKKAYHLLNQQPELKIWLVGDGGYRETIYDNLRRDGLRNAFAMPGSFGNLEDVFAAADVFLSFDDNGHEYLLPAAVTASLPILSADSHASRWLLESKDAPESVYWFDPSSAKSLRSAVKQSVSDLQAGQNRGANLRRHLLRQRSMDGVYQQYLQLFDELMRGRASLDSSSVGAVS